jgi:hypothetical protein
MSFGTVQAEKMTTESGYSLGAGNASSFKNRVINGAMVVNQYAAGTQTNIGTTLQYPCDRFYTQGVASAGVFTSQISSDAPAGFNSSMLLTVTTASTPSGTQVYRTIQRIEGYNTADFNLGTANAQALTLSFWVKASVTGTFGGSLWGGGATAWFPFSYTINSANTWEKKTVSIGAATSTPSTAFNTTNGIGLQLTLNIGAGSSSLATAGSWIYGSTEYYGATGQTNLISTNGATWQITGVQLEVGTVATSFDFRSYGTELSLCQRYFQTYAGMTVPFNANGNSGNNGYLQMVFPVVMRSAPSVAATTVSVKQNATSYSYTISSIATIATGMTEIFGTASTNPGYADPTVFYFTTLNFSSEL